MRVALLSSFLLAGIVGLGAQAPVKPAAPQPAPSQPRPAPAAGAQTPAPAQPRRPAAPARGGMTITVTDPVGATLPGVHVTLTGPTDRNANTDQNGKLNFTGLLAGTYRLGFTGETVIPFEKEVTLRAGQIADIDITLNPAPEPPPPPPPPPQPAPAQPPPAAPVGPRGQPQTLGIEDLLDRDFVGRDPRRESLLSCSGNERASMIQLNEPLPQRLYENADVVYYVLAGEGNVVLAGRNSRIATNGFISVPRGTAHSFERRGNRPLVLLAVLGGEPCERAK